MHIIRRSALLHPQKKYTLLIGVFLLVFGIRFAYTVFLQLRFGSDAFIAFSDASAFVLIAENLLERGVYSVMQVAPFISDSLRTPLYPFVLAGFFWAKIPIIGFIVLQNILAGVVGVLLVRLGNLLFKNTIVGLIAALIYGFEPASIYWNGLVMPDNIFAFLVILSLYLFAKKQWYWFAFSIGIATFARPISMYFFPVFMLLYIYMAYSERRNVMLHVKQILVMTGILIVVVSPWVIRNKIVFNTYEFSSAGWVNTNFPIPRFAREQNLPYEEPKMPADFFPSGAEKVYRAEYLFAYDFSNVPFYKEQFFRIISERPIEYSVYHLGSMVRSLTGHDYEYLFTYVIKNKFQSADVQLGALFVEIGNSLWLLLYVFMLFGLFLKGHRQWKIFMLFFIVWNSVLVALAGGSWGGRYNLPVAPIMFLLASFGMNAWYNMIKKFYVRHKRI